ncbi:IS110 family transposase, partial [Bradyrhizobium sp. AC87j1]
RSLLVVGATAVLRVVRNDAWARPWLKALLARRPFKVAAVAQANKTARIICALLNKVGIYRRPDPLAATAVTQ